ncbi:MAG: hypothetical protein ACKOBV_09610 [Candidatus Kapaibacterium sp.]
MKRLIAISLLLLSLISGTELVASRTYGRMVIVRSAGDPIARVSVDNLSQRTVSEFEFDVHVKRTSPIWERWAGSTFQFRIDGLVPDQYDSTKMVFSMIPGSSQLLEQKYVKDVLTRYVIAPEIVTKSNLAVTVLGPDEFTYTKFIP